MKIAVIVSRFNERVTEELLRGALDELRGTGLGEPQVLIYHVPGTFEIPWACRRVAKTAEPDGILALGAIIRGETEHHRYLAQAVLSALVQLSVELDIPVTHAVLTTDNLLQAMERTGGKLGHKGREAARALIHCLNLKPARE